MRFRTVTAHSFGPFKDQSLDFAPGMNVVYGPNEAGKSTWHAALYAGLCGRRRGRGPARKQEQWLEERHRPWSRSDWKAGVIAALADGRNVELTHDLAARVGAACDADFAQRDYTKEILADGAPDGSRWLGLNRGSFLSTACVRQAQLLQIADDPNALREDLQRAATTAEQEGTAASALSCLEAYRRDHVGSERAPTKPLLIARRATDDAKAKLKAARKKNEELHSRRRGLARLEHEAQTVRDWVRAIRAVVCERDAQAAARRVRDATQLSQLFPDDRPPDSAHDASIAERVGAALRTWNERPSQADLTEPEGPDAAELQRGMKDVQRQIRTARAGAAHHKATATKRRLTEAETLGRILPKGLPLDTEQSEQIAVSVIAALQEWESRPSRAETSQPGGLSAATLQEAITKTRRTLRLTRAIIATKKARDARARFRRAEVLSAQLPRSPLYTAAEATRDQQVAEALAAWEERPSREPSKGTPAATHEKTISEIKDRIARLPPVATQPHRHLAVTAVGALFGGVIAAVMGFGFLLLAIAVAVCGGSALWIGWRREQNRARTTANRLAELEQQLHATEDLLQNRRREEELQSRNRRQREEVVQRLRVAAATAGLDPDDDTDQLAKVLAGWLKERREERDEREKQMPLWTELHSILSDGSLDDLRTGAQEQDHEAARLAEEFEPSEIEQVLSTNDPPQNLVRRENDLQREVEQLIEDRAARQGIEARVEVERKRLGRMRASICEAAEAAGIAGTDDETRVSGLLTWKAERERRLQQMNQLRKQRDRFQQLTRGEPLEELRTLSRELDAKAAAATQGFSAAELKAVRENPIRPDRLEELEQEAESAKQDLDKRHRERLGVEERLRAHRKSYAQAADAVRRAAADAKIAAENDPETLVLALGEWQDSQDRRLTQQRKLRKDWDHLQQLKGDGSLATLEADRDRLLSAAIKATRSLDSQLLDRARRTELSEEEISSLGSDADEAKQRSEKMKGELEEFEKSVPSLADAEDALSGAQAEQGRLEVTARTLDTTTDFLKRAQEKVHRTIAPQLRRSVQDWLPRVTAGRYTRCWIDPDSLEVEVAGTDVSRRRATLLSRGTAEQVFLLVRLAMAKHLTKRDESCPLLLDDALAGSDSERRRAVLHALLEISTSTQVILFTHAEDIRDWARGHLAGPNSELIEL